MPRLATWIQAVLPALLGVHVGSACSADVPDESAAEVPGIAGMGAVPIGGMASMGTGGMAQAVAGGGGVAAGSSAGGASGASGGGGAAGLNAAGSGGAAAGAAGTAGAGNGGASGGGDGGAGAGGMAGGSTMTGGTGGSPGNDACAALPADRVPPYMPVHRVPLRVHTTRSDLARDDLCGALEEVNDIWWTQAGVCFEIEIVGDDEVAQAGMDLWFERSSPFPNGVDANGVYSGPHEIYSLDEPSLGQAANPTQYLHARTAAHELGHGLGLDHQNCGQACNDLLMTSGRRGFAIVTGSPANLDEQARARDRASRMAQGDTTQTICSAPIFRDDDP